MIRMDSAKTGETDSSRRIEISGQEAAAALTRYLDQAADRLISLGALVSVIIVAGVIPDLIAQQQYGVITAYAGATTLIVANALLRRVIPIRKRIVLLIATQVIAAMAIVTQLGVFSPPSVLGPMAMIITTVYFGVRRGLLLAVIFTLFFACVGFLEGTHAFQTAEEIVYYYTSPSRWLRITSITVFSSICLLIIGWALHSSFLEAQNKLIERDEELERQLAMRTKDLASALDRARRSEEKVRDLAYSDDLTGLSNRYRLEAFYEELESRKGELLPEIHMLATINIRDFSEINDVYGIEHGNLFLKNVAGLLLSACGPRDIVGRIAADEFVVILRSGINEEELSIRLQRLKQTVDGAIYVGGHQLRLSTIIGGAIYPAHGDSFATLYRAANRAAHRARDHGGQSMAVFDLTSDSIGSDRLDAIEALRKALDTGELRLQFQPIVALDSFTVVGAEGLARWQDKKLKFRSPADFLPLAKESGQMHQLNINNLRQVGELLAAWQTPDSSEPPAHLSINFSATDLLDGDLVDTILDGDEIPPELRAHLIIEVTEADLVFDEGGLKTAVTRLRQAGLRVAIDDFGVGYSGLARLHQLKVDIVKLDGSFISDLESSAHTQQLVQAVISIAHLIGAKVTAEFVETAEQARLLRAMNCDYGQGNLFGRAMPAEKFMALAGKELSVGDNEESSSRRAGESKRRLPHCDNTTLEQQV